MKEEILINVTPQECRAAVIENGMLQEMYVERTSSRGLVGNIYRGKVIRVLPGMQAAFINIGRERSAFLHAAEILPISETELIENDNITTPDINELLHVGQVITVQVIKDEIGTKGARLTTHLTIPSRYLVMMPDNPHIGVSQRIEDEVERQRLRDILSHSKEAQTAGELSKKGEVEEKLSESDESPSKEKQTKKRKKKKLKDSVSDEQPGYIVRTAAEGAGDDELHRDADFLGKLWQSIKERIRGSKAPCLVYDDLDLALRLIRDSVPSDVETIKVDSDEVHTKLLSFVDDFVPALKSCVDLYSGERPLFDVYNVEDEIEKALHRKVQLKSGGYLIIEQTEAMVTIDVNTGAFVGYRNLEDTIFKTNLEASSALARQLRLRNLGGMVIIDFIDMKEDEHKRQVLRTLERALERDHAKTHISEVSSLGLVQMTRKRNRESLEHLLCESCPTCDNRGSIKTAQTICYEIFRELYRSARAYEAQKYLVLATQEVVDRMLDEEASYLAELESSIGKPIRFQAERLYTQEQFDVVLL
ncbi:Rne/Rng family ribonuclease [Aliikangiella coralliicola]|uniref:Rne/Rng family ribonuclease n=1 Tax=Aliikangiella coralliicola TaxID=2592383 RepID=A0A545UB39_9GAMM|nr:Rne/Rng family ribonuclease [Aliikangiella coralliicola]TQV86667.1 Rne/Rng family ribonuclease [Aliikangiella coralliicola]